jgi:antitoxin component HigA of HigAB toxin-antitoxin module
MKRAEAVAASPQVPPARSSEVRAKHLPIQMPVGNKLVREHLKERRLVVAAIFHELLVRRGIPAAELAEVAGIGEKELREMRSGARALTGEVIFAFEQRFALALLDELRFALLRGNQRHE